jgi:hypothetical protein
MGDRGEAGQAGRAFVLDGAELRHLDEHGERCGVADARDAHDVEAGLQRGIGGELRVHGRADRGDLAFHLPEALFSLTLEQRQAVRVASVLGGDSVLDQAAAGDMQLLHRVEGRADDGSHRRLDEGREQASMAASTESVLA